MNLPAAPVLFVVWIPLVVQGVLPAGLLIWLAWRRPRSRLSRMLGTLLVATVIALVGTAGLWLALPWYLPVLYSVALAPAALASSRRCAGLEVWPSGRREGVGAIALGALTVGCAALLLQALAGRREPPGTVELALPLRAGTYLVANGGARELLNAHFATLTAARLRRWRGQSYGVDLVRLGPYGLPAAGFLPPDPAAYAIFGDTILAPCSGRVLGAEDGQADLRPPVADRQHLAGNHVLLRCGEVWVLLGHMQQGSVAVRPGDSVAAGRPVGRVGNTGNTTEPHLHVHAQRPGTPTEPLSGEPVPIRFGSTYPSRGQRLRSAAP
ncbi:MAG TPA: M23 family metallopeptidase [Gemmatimonadales bacterium]|nr:M23 family metallopeptidase [Gemmatimonadales bacterium]